MHIVRCLPIHIRAKWVERADQIIERGYEHTFSDLTEFVEERVRIAGTLYGRDIALGSERNPVKLNKGKMRPPGSTFYTQEDSCTTRKGEAEVKGKGSHPRTQKRKCCLCANTHHLSSKERGNVLERKNFAIIVSTQVILHEAV